MLRFLLDVLSGAICLCLAVQAAASSTSRASFVRTFQDFLMAHGDSDTMPSNLAGGLKLTNGSSGYPVCGIQWEDDDKTEHLVDRVNGGIVVAFMEGNRSYSRMWRLSEDGTATAVVEVNKSGTHVLSSTEHSDQLDQQIAFWMDLATRNQLGSGAPCTIGSP